jgi:hypothetical protein
MPRRTVALLALVVFAPACGASKADQTACKAARTAAADRWEATARALKAEADKERPDPARAQYIEKARQLQADLLKDIQDPEMKKKLQAKVDAQDRTQALQVAYLAALDGVAAAAQAVATATRRSARAAGAARQSYQQSSTRLSEAGQKLHEANRTSTDFQQRLKLFPSLEVGKITRDADDNDKDVKGNCAKVEK